MGGSCWIKQSLLLKKKRLDDRSRMTGDCHVRFCESLGVRLPRATRLYSFQGRFYQLRCTLAILTIFSRVTIQDVGKELNRCAEKTISSICVIIEKKRPLKFVTQLYFSH